MACHALQTLAMVYRPTAIERAFIIAASGNVRTVGELREALKAEGYPEEGHLRGPSISNQLAKLIHASTGKPMQDGAAGRASQAKTRAARRQRLSE